MWRLTTYDRRKTGWYSPAVRQASLGAWLNDFVVPLFTALVERGGRLFRTPCGKAYPISEDVDDNISGQLKSAILGARRRSGILGVSPYTARHTVSTQLVINGVHSHIKDQILEHAVDDMSRHYTHVPRTELIAAINTLPVVPAWCSTPWWNDPVSWQRKLAAGTGAWNDLRNRA
jgi:integrase/recombinase XerD